MFGLIIGGVFIRNTLEGNFFPPTFRHRQILICQRPVVKCSSIWSDEIIIHLLYH